MTTSYKLCTDAHASRFIKTFWQTAGKPQYQIETILPTGVIELIFSFEDPGAITTGNQSNAITTPRCFVSGLSNLPIQLIAPGQQAFFGVELHPAAVKKLLKVPAGAFINTITDLETIGKEFNGLWHRLAAADSFQERITIMQTWLAQRQCMIPSQELAIAGFLNRVPEPLSVAAHASRFCYSARQLHRKTQELFGMSTESLIRYHRYVHALHLIQYSQDTLTGIGYECLYYDQAHFIREFKDFTGLTPGNYRRQKSNLPGHLYNNVRYVQ